MENRKLSILTQNDARRGNVTIMLVLGKLFLLFCFGFVLACGVAVEKEEIRKPQEKVHDTQFTLVTDSLFLTPEEEQCVVSYPDLKAENILEGVTISGVTGTSNFTYPTCSETIVENCLATAEFPAAKMEGLASKVALGQTVGGVAGTTAVQTQSDCSAANQTDCIATATYPTMDLSEQGNDSVASLTGTNFASRMTSNASFEYWDASGNRNVNTGDADITTNNIRSGVNLLGTDGPTDPLDCASIAVGGTWIMVPGDPDYGTNDFCVMKYEAKCSAADGSTCAIATHSPLSQASNTPWVSIDQQDAMTECTSLGKGFHLISNDEWMTLATNIGNVDSNWSNGAVGDGQLKRGHSDDDPSEACAASSDASLNVVETDCTSLASANDEFTQQRTHTLSNGEVIWDLAGNVFEWTSYFNDEEKPTPLGDSWRHYTEVSSTTTMPITDLIPQIALDNSWDANSIGRYYPGTDGSGGALVRGGRYNSTTFSGIFTAYLRRLPTNLYAHWGFRCAVSMP